MLIIGFLFLMYDALDERFSPKSIKIQNNQKPSHGHSHQNDHHNDHHASEH